MMAEIMTTMKISKPSNCDTITIQQLKLNQFLRPTFEKGLNKTFPVQPSHNDIDISHHQLEELSKLLVMYMIVISVTNTNSLLPGTPWKTTRIWKKDLMQIYYILLQNFSHRICWYVPSVETIFKMQFSSRHVS